MAASDQQTPEHIARGGLIEGAVCNATPRSIRAVCRKRRLPTADISLCDS